MDKLKEANLYQSELIPVSGKLVERYNKCLKTLGFKETNLKGFSIDGVGWSPEIAEEKKNVQYLNHGDANPHGIIITPLQKGKPVYLPFHSFDREMMQHIFRTHGQKINDITRDSAICIDFDQDIDAYYEPLDILKYDDVSITFRLIDDLNKVQQKQLRLVDKFTTGHNFIDEDLQQELLQSAKNYGDLRNRDLNLTPLHYSVGSFFSRAFGGVYVLRDFVKTIVVFENEEVYQEAIKDTYHDVLIFHIEQPELIKKLEDYQIISYDLEAAVGTKRYERIKKYYFTQHVVDREHALKEILDSKSLFRSYLNKMAMAERKKVMGVELYLERIARSNAFKLEDMVSKELFNGLLDPHSSLSPNDRDIIHRLLVNISPLDVLFLYWYDKEQFYSSYKEWDDS
ncbi:MAG: DUF6638 family protein, partial [Bacteroidota bacterium]